MKKSFAKLSAFLLAGSLILPGCQSMPKADSLLTLRDITYVKSPVDELKVKKQIAKKIRQILEVELADLEVEEVEFNKGRKSYFVDIRGKNGYELVNVGLPSAMTYNEFTIYFSPVLKTDYEEIWELINASESSMKLIYGEETQKYIRMIKKEFEESPYSKSKEEFIAYHLDINRLNSLIRRLAYPHERVHETQDQSNPVKREIEARLGDLEREGYEYLDLGYVLQDDGVSDNEAYKKRFQTPLAVRFIRREYIKRTPKDFEELARQEIRQIARDIRIDLERGAFPEEDFKYN